MVQAMKDDYMDIGTEQCKEQAMEEYGYCISM
jgi:hypothetical protein